MVCRLSFILLVLFNCLCIGPAFADVALFSDAPDPLIEKAKKENYEFIIKYLYFAKKHKFVVLNQDAFFQQDNLIIDLFNGGSITFEFVKIEQNNKVIEWHGKHSTTKAFLYNKYGIDESNEDQWHSWFIQSLNDQSSITIYSSVLNVVRDKKGEVRYEYPYTYEKFIKVQATGSKYLTKETLRTTSFGFDDVISGESYSVRYLPNTPNVLLLREIDRDKLLPFSRGDTFRLPPEKQQQYDEYKQKLDAYLKSHGIEVPRPMTKKEERDWFYNGYRKSILEAPSPKIKQQHLKNIASFEKQYPQEVKKLLKEFGNKKTR